MAAVRTSVGKVPRRLTAPATEWQTWPAMWPHQAAEVTFGRGAVEVAKAGRHAGRELGRRAAAGMAVSWSGRRQSVGAVTLKSANGCAHGTPGHRTHVAVG